MIVASLVASHYSVDLLLLAPQDPMLVIILVRFIVYVARWKNPLTVADDVEHGITRIKSALHLVQDMSLVVQRIAVADKTQYEDGSSRRRGRLEHLPCCMLPRVALLITSAGIVRCRAGIWIRLRRLRAIGASAEDFRGSKCLLLPSS